jgi:hypothetical protein
VTVPRACPQRLAGQPFAGRLAQVLVAALFDESRGDDGVGHGMPTSVVDSDDFRR